MPAAKYALKSPLPRQQFKQGLQALADVSWQEKAEQHCDYRMDGKLNGGWLRAKQFTNGTLYLEASDDTLLCLMTGLLDGQAPAEAKSALASASVKPKTDGVIDIVGTYIGTDESGKGDYFGPLVIAGVVVNDQSCAILKELGVMDSKKLNALQVAQLEQDIIRTVGVANVSIVEIGPAKYNQLYDKFKQNGKNLNHLLAWGHATVIENLLGNVPDCMQAIADQFGSEHYILSQLKAKGKGITLHQTHRAEANVGVAAASILARQRFVGKIKKLSAEFGMNLPLGAGPQVKTQARRFIQQNGRENLAQIAKLHFKTTQEL